MGQICQGTSNQAAYACNLTGPGAFIAGQNNSPQAAIGAETISITSPYQFIRNVNKQIQKLRDCESSEGELDTSNKRSPECKDSGGGSSSDTNGYIGPFGVSFSGGGGFGDQETTDQTGFKIDTRQANLIIDYPFAKNLTGGFAFNYVSTDRSLDLASGSLNSDSYRFAPFLSFIPAPNSYITLMGGYARVDFDSNRKISPFTDIGGTLRTLTDAKANYSADEYFASLGAGYTWRMDAWSLRGYGRADYNELNIGGFQENGAIDVNDDSRSYALKVDRQSILSATSTLGAELSYVIRTATLAPVVIPNVHAEWVHEFENSGREIKATFNRIAKDDGTLINPVSTGPIAIEGPQRNWANVGFGLQMIFPNAIVGYLNYDTLFIENASNQTVSGGVRINF
jgi:uncharacterized protein with beta-barrel porin domain